MFWSVHFLANCFSEFRSDGFVSDRHLSFSWLISILSPRLFYVCFWANEYYWFMSSICAFQNFTFKRGYQFAIELLWCFGYTIHGPIWLTTAPSSSCRWLYHSSKPMPAWKGNQWSRAWTCPAMAAHKCKIVTCTFRKSDTHPNKACFPMPWRAGMSIVVSSRGFTVSTKLQWKLLRIVPEPYWSHRSLNWNILWIECPFGRSRSTSHTQSSYKAHWAETECLCIPRGASSYTKKCLGCFQRCSR